MDSVVSNPQWCFPVTTPETHVSGFGDTPAISGLGVLAPNGADLDQSWAAALAGKPAINRITKFNVSRYPTVLAGQVVDFNVDRWVPKRLQVQTDPGTHYGLAAAEMAIAHSGMDLAAVPKYERAVMIASSSGGVQFGQREMTGLWSLGPEQVSAYQSIAWFYAATTGQASIRHGTKGQSGVLCTEQAGGLDAIGQACCMLRDGASYVIVGGYDSSLSPYGLCCLMTSGWLSQSTDPDRAYLPFDVHAAGHVPGEGAAMMTLEPASLVARRGRRIHGVILGYAASFDPPPWSNRAPALKTAIQRCLAQANTQPCDVDAVFADAAAVPDRDAVEAAVLTEVFQPFGVPVTAPKAGIGRLYAAGAAWDVAIACCALSDQILPPSVNVAAVAAAHRLDLVIGVARELPLNRILVLARGLGGFNAALLVGRAP